MQFDPSSFELVSVDGEMALLVRLGRRATDPIPALGRVTRAFKVKEAGTDSLDEFLADVTRRSTGARCRARPLFDRYCRWCEENARDRASLVGFHRAMKARGFSQVISNGHWWRDLDLLQPAVAGTLL